MDRRVRELERRWRESGLEEDRRAWISAGGRVGSEHASPRLVVEALLGDVSARLALAWGPDVDVSRAASLLAGVSERERAWSSCMERADQLARSELRANEWTCAAARPWCVRIAGHAAASVLGCCRTYARGPGRAPAEAMVEAAVAWARDQKRQQAGIVASRARELEWLHGSTCKRERCHVHGALAQVGLAITGADGAAFADPVPAARLAAACAAVAIALAVRAAGEDPELREQVASAVRAAC